MHPTACDGWNPCPHGCGHRRMESVVDQSMATATCHPTTVDRLGSGLVHALYAGQHPIRKRCKEFTHAAGMGAHLDRMDFVNSLERRTSGCSQHIAVRHQPAEVGRIGQVLDLRQADNR